MQFERVSGRDPESGTDRMVHQLRHTFATKILKEGLTLNDVRLLLGYPSIQTTQRYQHLESSDVSPKAVNFQFQHVVEVQSENHELIRGRKFAPSSPFLGPGEILCDRRECNSLLRRERVVQITHVVFVQTLIRSVSEIISELAHCKKRLFELFRQPQSQCKMDTTEEVEVHRLEV
jgi:hypothetical protein